MISQFGYKNTTFTDVNKLQNSRLLRFYGSVFKYDLSIREVQGVERAPVCNMVLADFYSQCCAEKNPRLDVMVSFLRGYDMVENNEPLLWM